MLDEELDGEFELYKLNMQRALRKEREQNAELKKQLKQISKDLKMVTEVYLMYCREVQKQMHVPVYRRKHVAIPFLSYSDNGLITMGYYD